MFVFIQLHNIKLFVKSIMDCFIFFISMDLHVHVVNCNNAGLITKTCYSFKYERIKYMNIY